mmetsp:Transcript_20703/g.51879  ORF Transcript_20703/g.51879 Transcript_20703/m.51879 type:complete len:244 (-) Transcript_20703:722-1453(-)
METEASPAAAGRPPSTPLTVHFSPQGHASAGIRAAAPVETMEPSSSVMPSDERLLTSQTRDATGLPMTLVPLPSADIPFPPPSLDSVAVASDRVLRSMSEALMGWPSTRTPLSPKSATKLGVVSGEGGNLEGLRVAAISIAGIKHSTASHTSSSVYAVLGTHARPCLGGRGLDIRKANSHSRADILTPSSSKATGHGPLRTLGEKRGARKGLAMPSRCMAASFVAPTFHPWMISPARDMAEWS